MTRPTLDEDVKAIVKAMRQGGKDAANAKFVELHRLRKLMLWEQHVLKSKVIHELTRQKLWPEVPRNPPPPNTGEAAASGQEERLPQATEAQTSTAPITQEQRDADSK